ncbi:MAG: hypothetical protein KDK65_05435, partial [Chlamydiia bacterium]|nr:hypothetical protein [Chlamydiia bacterium]
AVCQHIFLLFPIDTPDLTLTTEALEQLPSDQKERVVDLLVKTFWFDEEEKVLSLIQKLSEPSKVVKSLIKLAQKEK